MEADFEVWQPTYVKVLRREDVPEGVEFIEPTDPRVKALGVVLVVARIKIKVREVQGVQFVPIAD